jgi:hypothetical protein
VSSARLVLVEFICTFFSVLELFLSITSPTPYEMWVNCTWRPMYRSVTGNFVFFVCATDFAKFANSFNPYNDTDLQMYCVSVSGSKFICMYPQLYTRRFSMLPTELNKGSQNHMLVIN